jgi:hypothetical protein
MGPDDVPQARKIISEKSGKMWKNLKNPEGKIF